MEVTLMLRTLWMLSLVGFLVVSSGCAMCCNPFDETYPAYGGNWPSENVHGPRAGSAFGGAPVEQDSTVPSVLQQDDALPAVAPTEVGLPPVPVEARDNRA